MEALPATKRGQHAIQTNPEISAASKRLAVELEQEGVGVNRFNPLPLNWSRGATSALIEVPDGTPLSGDQRDRKAR